MASNLAPLPVDIAIPPEEVETTAERFDRTSGEITARETTRATFDAPFLIVIPKGAFEHFTRARIRKAEARRRLEDEDDAGIGEEMARLRRERPGRGSSEAA